MTLPYCWTHWFWITFYLSHLIGVDLAPQEAAPQATAILPLWLVHGPSAIVTETFPPAPTDPHFPFARQPQWTQYRETVNPELNLYSSSSLFESATRSLDGSETQNPVAIVETEASMLGDEPPRIVKSPSIPPSDISLRKQNNNSSETSSKLGEPIKKTTRTWAKDTAGAILVQANVSATVSNKSQSDKAPLSTLTEGAVNLTISARLPKTLPKQREITFGEDYNATDMPPPKTNLTLLEEIEAELQASQRQRPQETAAAVAAAEGLPDDRQLDAAAIAGIAVGLAATAALIVAASIVLYRRRYINQPHTLNDKCSNPDSSGYIDDTTLRENSEEMYSLDNDSFLNSLEAMTIQNYWTDSVKHTKL